MFFRSVVTWVSFRCSMTEGLGLVLFNWITEQKWFLGFPCRCKCAFEVDYN